MRKNLHCSSTTAPDISAPATDAATSVVDDDLWDNPTVRAFFGGISASTLSRGITAGRYPQPLKIGPHLNRWLRSECVAARADIAALRNGTATTARPDD